MPTNQHIICSEENNKLYNVYDVENRNPNNYFYRYVTPTA